MLDRKTKDIDASIELLEDRKKFTDMLSYLFIGCWFLVWIFYLYLCWTFVKIIVNYKETPGLVTNVLIGVIPIFILLAMMAYSMLFLIKTVDSDKYDMLIYLKRQFEKRKKHG